MKNFLQKKTLFFRSSAYRKSVRINFKNAIMFPYHVVNALYNILKEEFVLNRDYPNRWDRYVKRKQIQAEKEAAIEANDKRILRYSTKIEGMGFITFMNIEMLIFLDQKMKEAAKEKIEKIVVEFLQYQEEVLDILSQLEEQGVKIPEGLEKKIKDINLESFASFEEIEELGDDISEQFASIEL